MVLIPAGRFMMGSPETETTDLPKPGTRRTNESPLHEVIITRPFFISKFKVTQQQYEQIMSVNPSKFAGKDHPVDSVTWDDATLFCQKASAGTKRNIHLPTEAQWEYAARAGTDTRYSFGDDESKLPGYAWFHDNAKGQTYPVGQKLPNAWGLFDVHGLLWEYASDFYADSYTNGTSKDPIGPASGTTHSTRGGTYGSRPPFLRSAVRIESPRADSSKDVMSHFGFRVVMDIEGALKR
jgi:formylglycine-generating enzyme required for sulfatase activity